MKRLINWAVGTFFVAMGLAVSMNSAVAYAEEIRTVELELIQEGDLPEPVDIRMENISQYLSDGDGIANNNYNADKTAEETIYDGLCNLEASIDLSSYNITEEQFLALTEKIINGSPELFYVNHTISYSMSGGYVIRITPTYTANSSTLVQQKNYYNQQINYIVGLVDSGWTEEQKVLFVNDYMAQNYEYDTSYSIYDAYNLLYQKKGVCQAYTLVFEAVMQELGLDVTFCSSKSMNHVWNVIKVGSSWYHVDVTWNDPVADLLGRAVHEHLLRSDSGIQDSGHSNYSTVYTCTNTKYDSYFWQESTTPFQHIGSKWYYAKYNSSSKVGELFEYDFADSSSVKIADLGKWFVYNTNNTSYFQNCYTGLDVYGGELYYNTYNKLWKYNPETKKATEVATPSVSGYIFGMRMDSNVIRFCYDSSSELSNNKISTYSVSVVEGGDEPEFDIPSGEIPDTSAADNREWYMLIFVLSGMFTVAMLYFRKRCTVK